MADLFDDATVTTLGDSRVEIIKLKKEFSTLEICSKELYVRECMRELFDSLNQFRKSDITDRPNNITDRPNKNPAVIGEPGIGKSCSLYYFAYRFLKEDDVDLVVILDDESDKLHVFCKGDDIKLTGVHEKPWMDDVLKPLSLQLQSLRERAVLLLDIDQHVRPRDRLSHDTGLTVFASSPGPYRKWLAKMKHKLRLQIYSPPPLTKLETKAVFDHIRKGQPAQMSFEEYFDAFGGTIRPMMGADEEFGKMTEGSSKLLRIAPSTIVDLVERGAEEEDGEDCTHALFADLGGNKEDNYKVPRLSTSRSFRSKFSEFWFRQHIAPHILFKKYTADILSLLYTANKVANGGSRGCEFEDLFHKLLPLGNWTTREVSEEQGGSPWQLLATFFGAWGGLPSEEPDSSMPLVLMNVPVFRRGEDEVDEVDLDERWNKKFGRKESKNSTSTESRKEDNRRDVAKLIATCKERNEFYWLPRGQSFPGIDSVHKNASSLNFVQVKTGGVAEDASKWIDAAIHFSKLLFELLPIASKEQLCVSILVGTEPARRPILKKRKRDSLDIPENWSIRYVLAPVAGRIPENLELNMTRYQNELKAEFLTFKKRQQILETPVGLHAAVEAPALPKIGGLSAVEKEIPEKQNAETSANILCARNDKVRIKPLPSMFEEPDSGWTIMEDSRVTGGLIARDINWLDGCWTPAELTYIVLQKYQQYEWGDFLLSTDHFDRLVESKDHGCAHTAKLTERKKKEEGAAPTEVSKKAVDSSKILFFASGCSTPDEIVERANRYISSMYGDLYAYLEAYDDIEV